MSALSIELPLKVISALNAREHHMARSRRVKAERKAVGLVLQSKPRPALPISVHLVRRSPRTLDSHDNLCSAFKGTVDEIARVFGIDDRSDLMSVTYAQEKTKAAHGIRIVIASRDNNSTSLRATP
ncbi:hypothetical protein [Nevskia sp.]|uniref:hypothetical protein n=1 Tax=Nevskia sp. TaxID=1929292 RepID=UPI0025CF29F8|nr:hypothetical protein [Nevskia sp.]